MTKTQHIAEIKAFTDSVKAQIKTVQEQTRIELENNPKLIALKQAHLKKEQAKAEMRAQSWYKPYYFVQVDGIPIRVMQTMPAEQVQEFVMIKAANEQEYRRMCAEEDALEPLIIC